MNTLTTRRYESILAIGTCMAFLPVQPAHADITSATYTNATLFHYRVQHMPDIDQRRSSLPCNGSIHCVPTCATNMVMYTANHGFPDLEPGPGYWEGDTNYIAASNAVLLMGALMQTSCANGGTSGGPANTGLTNWINVISDVDGLVVNDHLSVDGFSTNHAGIGKSLCGGRVGSVSFGYYDIVGSVKGIPLVDRDGGHCVTAVKVRRNGASRDLWVRDPASDEGDNTSQSAFANDILPISDLTVIVMPDMNMKTMTAIDFTPGDSTVKLIDGHRTLTPAQGYSWSSSLTQVMVGAPTSLLYPTPAPSTFPSPTGTEVLDLVWQDLSGEMLTVCQGPNSPTLHAVDLVSRLSQPVPTPIAPYLVTAGRSDNVFICSGQAVAIVHVPKPEVPPPPLPPRSLPHIAHAMTYDDARDDLILVSQTDRRLMRMDRSTAGVISVLVIPTAVPLGARIELAVNPLEDGVVYLRSDASNAIWKLMAGAGGLAATAINLAAAPVPRGIDFTDRGNLLVVHNNAVVEFEPPATDGAGWQPATPSVFTGMPADRYFRVTRSRTNFEEGVHDQPGWTKNIDASLIEEYPDAADCAADIAPVLDLDETVNVSDLLKVISDWGPCASAVSCIADINDDDAVNVADLLAVIAAWGPCP